MVETDPSASLAAFCQQSGLVIGRSPAMQALVDEITRVADSDLPVLISGATGTGKELVAALIHHLGSPPGSPFLDVNCGAIPESLIESQLFGHEKGAFTGASGRQEGYFSLAGNGVLFLDELGELPLWQQTKLLRVLETRRFRPVGGTVNHQFHGRVVAATHVDLEKRVAENRFREDLYYRLNIVQLHIPSLDQRREDIPQLVEHFAARHPRPVRFSDDALRLMQEAHWQGNVRELKNTVDRIAVMSDSGRIEAEDVKNYILLGQEEDKPASRINQLAASLLELDIPNKLAAMEYALINQALEHANGNKSSAARALGVHRKYIERRLNSFEEQLDEIHRLNASATEKMEQSRYPEAVADLRQAMQCLENGFSVQDYDDIKLDLLLKLSACLRNVHGWNDSEVVAMYEDVQHLTEKLNEPEKLNSVKFGMWVNQLIELDLDAALATTTAYWQEGRQLNNPNVTAQAAISMANTYFWLGDYPQTCNALQNFIDLYSHDQRIIIDLGHDPFIYYLMFKSLVGFQMGKVSQSCEALDNLLSYSREVNQPFNLATALQVGAWLNYKLGDLPACYQYASELLYLSQEQGFPFFAGIAEIFLGHRRAREEDYAAGRAMILKGFADKINGGKGQLFNSMCAIVLADIALERGEYTQGLKDIEQGIAVSVKQKERCYLAEERLMRGRLYERLGDERQALEDYQAALDLSHEVGSKAAELGSSYQLARLHYENNRRSDARRVLTPIVLRYLEQKGYAQLEQARALLSSIENHSLRSA